MHRAEVFMWCCAWKNHDFRPVSCFIFWSQNLTGVSFHGDETWDTFVGGSYHEHTFVNFMGDSFSRGEHISSFDLEMLSKVIKDGAVRQNTYDFLLVFYSSFGRISYCFCATVDLMPKWLCWATVTSKLERRSVWITYKMKSPWDWAISCKLMLKTFMEV